MRRSHLLISLLATMGLVLAACGGAQTTPSPGDTTPPAASPTDGGSATGGTVRIGTGGAPDSLNPGNGVLAESYTLYELIYNTPIGINADGEYVPELASSWEVADDEVTWTMTLIEGATFHDGEPLTAEDVVYSIELYKATDDFPFLSTYAYLFETIEAVDDTTVVLTTEEPLGNFEANIVFMYVLPKHIWEAEDDPIAFENDDMIGSGPFKLADYTRGEFVQLETNTDYWGTVPNIDGVLFRTISNSDARITALTTGEVDAISEFPATAIASLRNADNVNVHIADVAAGGSLRDVFFNVTDEENCPEDGVCSGHPALKDVAVRQALAMATDKEQIIDVATLGTGSPGLSVVPPGLGEFFADDVEDWAYDPGAANAMLDEAGYLDSDGDGVRECLPDQDCETLTLRFNFADDIDTAPREAELIAGMWSEVGVQVQIQGLDPDTLTSVCCPTFDFDVILWGWGSDPDPAFLLGVALCSEIPTGFSETGYCNPEFDELYDAQAVETDPDERVRIIREMQRILVEDVPYIIPYYGQSIQAWRTDTFTGWPEDDPTLGIEDATALSALRPAQ